MSDLTYFLSWVFPLFLLCLFFVSKLSSTKMVPRTQMLKFKLKGNQDRNSKLVESYAVHTKILILKPFMNLLLCLGYPELLYSIYAVFFVESGYY